MTITGIVVDFGKKKALKKSTLPKKNKHIFGKKNIHFTKKALLEQKKALTKHYFINKTQQESTYN